MRQRRVRKLLDSLIGQYMNFIQAETVRFTQGVPCQVREDQLSGHVCFYEAVQGYERGRGERFCLYAAASIRNRLIELHQERGAPSGIGFL